MDPYHTIEHAGCVIEFHQDDTDSDSRGWSNLGRMYCWHPDYKLGDEQFTQRDHESMEAVIEHLRTEEQATHIYPLFLLDHSGISIRASFDTNLADESDPKAIAARDRFVGDAAGWDTTHVGFTWTNEKLTEEIGTSPERIVECMRQEVEAYDNDLTGNVSGYVVKFEGETVGSCWGFNGADGYSDDDYMVEEAKAEADAHAEEREREAKEAAYWAERGVVTVG